MSGHNGKIIARKGRGGSENGTLIVVIVRLVGKVNSRNVNEASEIG